MENRLMQRFAQVTAQITQVTARVTQAFADVTTHMDMRFDQLNQLYHRHLNLMIGNMNFRMAAIPGNPELAPLRDLRNSLPIEGFPRTRTELAQINGIVNYFLIQRLEDFVCTLTKS